MYRVIRYQTDNISKIISLYCHVYDGIIFLALRSGVSYSPLSQHAKHQKMRPHFSLKTRKYIYKKKKCLNCCNHFERPFAYMRTQRPKSDQNRLSPIYSLL